MIEQILQARTKQVDHQYVVKAFLAKVVDIGNARCQRVSVVYSFLSTPKTIVKYVVVAPNTSGSDACAARHRYEWGQYRE
jgi:hypothetical protein